MGGPFDKSEASVTRAGQHLDVTASVRLPHNGVDQGINDTAEEW